MKLKSIAAVAVTLCLSLAAGCQSAGSQSAGSSAPSATSPRSVVVTTRGGQQTILLPSTNGNNVTAVAQGEDHTCPKCKEDAVSFFKGGTMVSQCTACGSTYKVADK
jgi:DNA-directed RNA polymerase subunit M/transcription elongation factor TFIIS